MAYNITDFIRSAPISPIDLIHTINQVLESITNPTIKSIVSFCVTKVEEKLNHYPAAKTHHHAYFARPCLSYCADAGDW